MAQDSTPPGFRDMGGRQMSEQGSRSRWSLLVLGIIAVSWGAMSWGAMGCESRAEGAAPGADAVVGAQPGQPERVVQHMTPTPASPAAAEGAARAERRDVASSGVASSGAGAARAPEPITSRHLEAELNRLEAELAN